VAGICVSNIDITHMASAECPSNKSVLTFAVRCCVVLCCAVLCRRECEKYALACANPDYGNLSFANGEEAEAIETVGAMELFM
jgi:hypothetical protein